MLYGGFLAEKADLQAMRLVIKGTVQGVGFRPFVYACAIRLGISGSVGNSSEGVVIEATGTADALTAFSTALSTEAPPLAKITSIEHSPLPAVLSDTAFRIIASSDSAAASASIPADIALCHDCHNELLNPEDRRFHYPFINCTNCGPRFSIVETIPYDRQKTSMRIFPLCADCLAEYNDPLNRRFHAQPNACGNCGPQVSLHAPDGSVIESTNAIQDAADLLQQGKVLAMRGLGGFHLCVDAFSETAVDTLRQRKHRPDKPLAVMVPDLKTARLLARIDQEEEALLLAPEHPIILLPKLEQGGLAANLAPGIDEIGLMLAYTPLHVLLFEAARCPRCLVMTSGNPSGAPICTSNQDALEGLASIADCFLFHNREIVIRVDDSVVRVAKNHRQILRRARGYVPNPLPVPWDLPTIIGCGAGLKNTVAIGRAHEVVCSQHIGDLTDLETFRFYEESVEHLQRLLQAQPLIAACDLHPDYLSTRYAIESGLPLYRIQHHHAHAAAVMAEHQLTEPVLAVILDGTGYGTDGTIWGGEILLADLCSFTRLGHLSTLPMPGGDAATYEPWRMALAALFAIGGLDRLNALPAALKQIPEHRRSVIATMLTQSINTPRTSSCGRLFDAVAALLGVRQIISYEGQAAIELESLAKSCTTSTWYHDIPQATEPLIASLLIEKQENVEISSPLLIKVLLDECSRGVSRARIALRFHCLLIGAISALIDRLSATTGLQQIVLSGGCMHNRLLLEGLEYALLTTGKKVFTGETIPVNDGGISVGQTIIGGLLHVSRNTHAGCPG